MASPRHSLSTRAYDDLPLLEEKTYAVYCQKFQEAFRAKKPRQYIQGIANMACNLIVDKTKKYDQDTQNRVCAFISKVNMEIIGRSTSFIQENDPDSAHFLSHLSENYAEWGARVLKLHLNIITFNEFKNSNQTDDDGYVAVTKPTSPTANQSSNASVIVPLICGLGVGLFYFCRETGILPTSTQQGPRPPGPGFSSGPQ
jgi:hypothetical protein